MAYRGIFLLFSERVLQLLLLLLQSTLHSLQPVSGLFLFDLQTAQLFSQLEVLGL
jgi:hypothetical protein